MSTILGFPTIPRETKGRDMAAMLVSETKEMGVVEALGNIFAFGPQGPQFEIGRASCRERV